MRLEQPWHPEPGREAALARKLASREFAILEPLPRGAYQLTSLGELVAGFALMNDYSEREYQIERGGQWSKGKSADGFAAFGPYLVTRDAFPQFGNTRLWLDVNGARKQDSNTNDLIFDVATLVSYLSRFMTLLPGDIVSTGTPAGVGMGHKPPVFLKGGDVVEYGIDGLGQVRQRIVAGAAP